MAPVAPAQLPRVPRSVPRLRAYLVLEQVKGLERGHAALGNDKVGRLRQVQRRQRLFGRLGQRVNVLHQRFDHSTLRACGGVQVSGAASGHAISSVAVDTSAVPRLPLFRPTPLLHFTLLCSTLCPLVSTWVIKLQSLPSFSTGMRWTFIVPRCLQASSSVVSAGSASKAFSKPEEPAEAAGNEVEASALRSAATWTAVAHGLRTRKVAQLGILDVLERHQVLQARALLAALVAKVVDHAERQLGNVDNANVPAGGCAAGKNVSPSARCQLIFPRSWPCSGH